MSGVDVRNGQQICWSALPWVYDDGGRAAAGFKGEPRDCVCRAIVIATEQIYSDVYRALNEAAKRERPRNGNKRSRSRTGIHKPTIRRFMKELGWDWIPTMQIGSGCTVHLRTGELPAGRLVVSVSKHLVAVIDGEIRDTHDPGRGGTRCVYGYWKKDQESAENRLVTP